MLARTYLYREPRGVARASAPGAWGLGAPEATHMPQPAWPHSSVDSVLTAHALEQRPLLGLYGGLCGLLLGLWVCSPAAHTAPSPTCPVRQAWAPRCCQGQYQTLLCPGEGFGSGVAETTLVRPQCVGLGRALPVCWPSLSGGNVPASLPEAPRPALRLLPPGSGADWQRHCLGAWGRWGKVSPYPIPPAAASCVCVCLRACVLMKRPLILS